MNSGAPPILTLYKGSTPGNEVELGDSELVIGRDLSADLVIDSPVVSRHHCKILKREGDWIIEDMGSSNGTYLNGQRISNPSTLTDGDRIGLGRNIHLEFTSRHKLPHTEQEPMAQTVVEAQPPAQAATMKVEEFPQSELSPPQFMVSVAGGETEIYTLNQSSYLIGRSPDCDIVIGSPLVSARHAVLERETDPTGDFNNYTFRVLPNTTNPLFYRGETLNHVLPLQHGDVLRIGSVEPGLVVSLSYHNPSQLAASHLTRQIQFGDQNRLQVGRDPANDIVLDNPLISRFHALVERVGQRFRVRDLGSTNGTFVNDQTIDAETWLASGDQLRIGPYRFELQQDTLTEFDESNGLEVEALGLNKWVRKDLNLLKDISLIFKPREFIVVVGQSGGGKSTLVDAIAGYRPASDGQVLVNGTDIYKHFDAIRNEIGFVPQRDIIHMELTVSQALDYAAQLRMPPDTSPEERHNRVMEVLQTLDLEHRKDVQISGLSGGQQKRVSIGVELLTKPGLFFLDEPSSGLDPGTETALMHLMRRLADQGRTIILITHATKNVMLADKVLFLARGGYLAWFGPPDEALAYFDAYRSDVDRRSGSMEFDEIYAILDDPSMGSAEDWAKRYLESPSYSAYIVDPLKVNGHSIAPPDREDSSSIPAAEARSQAQMIPSSGRISKWRQFSILSSRNLKILTRDRTSLVLMLIAPIAVALLDVVMALVLGRNVFDYQDGDMFNALTSFFMTLMYAFLVGSFSQMREFVKEQDIYKRERLVNLKVLPYVSSKVWVAILLALYQAGVFTAIHHLAYEMPGGFVAVSLYYLTMFLAVLAGMMMGLFASALAPNANAAPLLVILLIVPQLVMAGAMIPLPTSLTSISAVRWSYESMIAISGAGSDVAADTCWQLPEEERQALSLDDKTALACNCMGLEALDPDSCQFPGLGAYYDPVIDQPEPLEPQPIGEPPTEPEFPPAPQPPESASDPQENARFMQELDQHQKEVDQIRADFQVQMDDYQRRADRFSDDMQDYQLARTEWEIDRNATVGKAEGLISSIYEEYDWTFVDKDDTNAYQSKLLAAWGALSLISGTLFAGTLYLVSRKK